MSHLLPKLAADFKKLGRLGLLMLFGIHAANVDATEPSTPSPIRWDFALINGLQVTEESLGIRDRIRVVTLGTSGCTPRSARLLTINPESGSEAVENILVQGRSIQFEVEGHARMDARLHIECQEGGASGGPPRTFVLSLNPAKTR